MTKEEFLNKMSLIHDEIPYDLEISGFSIQIKLKKGEEDHSVIATKNNINDHECLGLLKIQIRMLEDSILNDVILERQKKEFEKFKAILEQVVCKQSLQ